MGYYVGESFKDNLFTESKVGTIVTVILQPAFIHNVSIRPSGTGNE